jgi:hypothetical protein
MIVRKHPKSPPPNPNAVDLAKILLMLPVTPAKAGVQETLRNLDSGCRLSRT